MNKKKFLWIACMGLLLPIIIYDGGTTQYKYNHINWGNDGKDNGYFVNSVFDPDNYIWLDNNASSTNQPDYNTNLSFFTVRHE